MRPAALIPASLVMLLGLFSAESASASIAANSCDRTMEDVDAAKLIVLAKAKSVVGNKKGDDWLVRVTYTVDSALVGTKPAEVIIEDACNLTGVRAAPGTPGVTRECDNTGFHQLPGLTTDGKVGTSPVALLLNDEGPSPVDAKPVRTITHKSQWSPCPDEAVMVKKRPALKDLVAKVKDVNGKTSFGFLAPPAGATAASGSASASPPSPPSPPTSASATPVSTSSTPAPATSSAPPPQKSGGCSSCSVGSGAMSGAASAWPLVGLVLLSLRRRASRASRSLLRSR